MRITEKKYFEEYSQKIRFDIKSVCKDFSKSNAKTNFDYMTKVSAVYSSNIEGNSIDLNSYMNYELAKKKLKNKKEVDEIENLILAYQFAQSNELNENNFLHCHKISSESFLIESKQGKYRNEPVGVFSKFGLEYLAIEPENIKTEMSFLFEDIQNLLNGNYSVEEVFYFASLIHLKIAHIHPFQDGNGRIARLIEKWFLAIQLGKEFWNLPSEEYYKNNQTTYYKAINLGVNFYALNYDNCIDFLLMLPEVLKINESI